MYALCGRFGVEQGLKEDGTVKVRAIDNMSWSAAHLTCERPTKKQRKAVSINGHCAVHEAITHDHLDDLSQAMKMFCLLYTSDAADE
mgnify:CR=1 FL=1